MKIKISGHRPTSKKSWAMIAFLLLLFILIPSLALAEEAPVLNSGGYRLDADGHRFGAIHDHPWPVAVLRRHGAKQKHLVGAHAVFRHHITHDHIVDPLCL